MTRKNEGLLMSSLEIVQKAYKVDFSKILTTEGSISAAERISFCYAKSHYDARVMLFKDRKNQGWWLKSNGRPVTAYILPVIRIMENDIVMFEGMNYIRSTIPALLENRKRNAFFVELQNNTAIEFCYLKKENGSFVSIAGEQTFLQYNAEAFTKEKAIEKAMNNRTLIVVPVEKKWHNAVIAEKIKELRYRML